MPLRGTTGQIVETRRNGLVELSFEWQISDFFSLSDKVGHWYESPLFRFSDACWLMRLYPNGNTPNPTSIGLYLSRLGSGPPKTVNFACGIKSSDRVEKKFAAELEFSKNSGFYGFSLFCKRSELGEHESRLMPNNMLTITCNLKMDVGSDAKEGVSSNRDASIQTDEELREPNASHTDGSQPLEKRDASVQTDTRLREAEVLPDDNQSSGKQVLEELQSSLHSLLESGEDCDVTIKVRGKEFRAHRSILRARSPVFRAMFAHDMVEKHRGLVTMEDCDPETFPHFLEHIYTGSVGMISVNNVISLFVNSDKYDLKMLKKECAQFMDENMTVASFCDVITLAVKHNEKELTERATEFFCSNSLDIVKTAQWQAFLAENPTVGNELLIKLLSKHENIFRVTS